jgi:hypothetical protein
MGNRYSKSIYGHKKMNKLLMVCYGGGHVKIIAPLYQKLIGKYEITILALTTAAQYLMERNIPYITFSNFPELLTKEVLAYGAELIEDKPNQVINRNDMIAYLGLSFLDLTRVLGTLEAAQEKFLLEGRSAFLPVNTLSYIIDRLTPDVVITTNVGRSELAALIAAKEKKIKSICINDNLWIEGGAVNVAKNNLCDFLCVLSKEVKDDILCKTDYPSEKIVITGTPVFDDLKGKKNKISRSQRKVILLADCDLPQFNPRFPQGEGEPHFGYAIRKELNRLALLNDWEVIFRPHPNQKFEYDEFCNVRVSPSSENLHELLLKVDVVITAISTVGVEGKMLGCNLVSLERTVYSAAGSYAELGLSTGVQYASELDNAIKQELVNNTKDFMLYSGNSVDNIGLLIDTLML